MREKFNEIKCKSFFYFRNCFATNFSTENNSFSYLIISMGCWKKNNSIQILLKLKMLDSSVVNLNSNLKFMVHTIRV